MMLQGAHSEQEDYAQRIVRSHDPEPFRLTDCADGANHHVVLVGSSVSDFFAEAGTRAP